MSQKSVPVNFFIHDANGQRQMIKVVQQPLKQSVGHIQLASGNMKTIFKVPGTPDSASQSPGVYRTVNVPGLKTGSKLVQVPLQAITQLQKVAVSSSGGQSPAIKKVQTQGVSGVAKVLHTVPLIQSPKQSPQTPVTSADSKTHISSILTHSSRKRRDSDSDALTEYTSKRRKAADKVGKGLRHFSMKVCEKVKIKRSTSYNEVADELVTEFTSGIHGTPDNQQFDQKNIRRRVYDALNVLMAMNIISKEKKEIHWLGLPTNSIQEFTSLEKEKQIKLDRIQQKTQQLHDLILQQISFKCLVERNKLQESRGLTPSVSSAIQLPFIVVNTSDKTLVNCSISNDKMEYMFNFNERFQIHDDSDILKRMGLLLGLDEGKCTEADLQKAKRMVPKSLEHYINQLGRGVNVKMEDLLNIAIKEERDSEDCGPDGEEDEPEDCENTLNYSDEDDDVEDSSSDVDVDDN